MRTVIAVACVVAFSASLHAQGPSVAAAACERLAASLTLPHTTVSSAKAVAAGKFTVPGGGAAAAQAAAGLPAFCRVALTIKPSSDSDIKSEIWLPLSVWNGKYLQVGNGAWGGSIQYGALADTLRRGYAAASTDTGHTGTDASFAVGHPEKLIDFGYRSVHETAVQGKATVSALFGTAPRFSYFNGCSGGGRQSFMEAQRFPQDFDAIIAGAPGYNRTDGAFQSLGAAQATHKDAESFIPASKYPVLHQAALNKCDSVDGLKDGLITDPTRCQFDPAVTACKGLPAVASAKAGADGPSCLTPAQVVAARRIYAPVIDPKTGKEVFAGLEPGSEMHWAAISGEQPHSMYNDLARFLVFQDPKWDFRTLDISKHLEVARKADNGVLSATSPDLKPFVGRGGKLLIYHGWEDQNISPRMSVDYYKKVLDTMGKDQVDGAVRLFMVPGMGHCGGGDGPNEFDMVAALEEWREKGKAPNEIIASKVADGRVTRTRPLCPYPQVAKYKGTGSVDRAESFACTAP
jgi:feruloyl esterase